jgi:hypothetical protein
MTQKWRAIKYKLGSATGIMIAIGLLIGGCADITLPDPAVRYIAFGDSASNGPNEKNYWNFLAEKISQSSDRFANEGNGGEDTTEGVTRLQTLLADSIYPNAQVLLYWQGGDDLIDFLKTYDPLLVYSPDADDFPYKTQLQTHLDAVQARIEQSIALGQNAGLTVYVATYYYLMKNMKCKAAIFGFLLDTQAAHANAYLAKLNERIRLAVQNRQAVLVDVETQAQALLADRANYYNCNHLSDQGNRVVADVFYAVFTPVTD